MSCENKSGVHYSLVQKLQKLGFEGLCKTCTFMKHIKQVTPIACSNMHVLCAGTCLQHFSSRMWLSRRKFYGKVGNFLHSSYCIYVYSHVFNYLYGRHNHLTRIMHVRIAQYMYIKTQQCIKALNGTSKHNPTAQKRTE